MRNLLIIQLILCSTALTARETQNPAADAARLAVQLYQKEVQNTEALFKKKLATKPEILALKKQLLEARIQLADALDDRPSKIKHLKTLVDQYAAELKEARALYDKRLVLAREVEGLERGWLEVSIRLSTLEKRFKDTVRHLSALAEMDRKAVAMIVRLQGSGGATSNDLADIQLQLAITLKRLAKAQANIKDE